MRNNFFVTDVFARGIEGHIKASDLPMVILTHDGREAYHCAFELETASLKVEIDTGKLNDKGKPVYAYVPQSEEHRTPLSFNKYSGVARGTLGYAWFDFDSSDGGQSAFVDVKNFYEKLLKPAHIKFYYSGSKGFHAAIPMGYFNLQPSNKLPAILNHVATTLKRQEFKTLDTTVFNAQRKFRALGTKHGKTGLFKIEITSAQLETLSLDEIKKLAETRGSLEINEAPFVQPITWLAELSASFGANENDSISFKEWARYKRTTGERAMQECDFLKHCKENAASLSEPEWYAAASIVGRFENGRAQFQALSKSHADYSVAKTDEKLDQSLGSAGPRTCKGIQALWGKCFSCKHFEKIKSPVVILEKEVIATEATGFYFIEKNDKGIEKRTPDFNGLTKAYKRDKGYFVDSTADMVYTWTGTHYELTNEIEIKAWCEDVMNPAPSMRIANEFYNKIKRNFVLSQDEIEQLLFKSVIGKLNVQNGVLDIHEGIITPHDEAVGFRYVLPYEHDPEAKCPTFDKFLNDVTCGSEDLKQTLLEFMGYVLWPSYDDHCFLWLSGTGRNGKSTFLSLIEDLVGKKNTASVLLSQFEKSNYLQRMDGKLINISEESDSPKIPPEILGTLKALSSGAGVEVDQKFQVPYTMKPTAKLAFAANKPPYLSGTEDALKSRMIVVPFNLKLEEHSTEGTQSRIDWQLQEKLQKELPGILNRALEALRNFVRRTPRKIYRAKASFAAMNEIMRDSDPIEAWIQDNIEVVSSEKGTALEELFLNFKEESQDEYTTVVHFSRKLRQKLGDKVDIQRLAKNGKKARFVRGVVFRKEAQNTPDF